MTNGSYDIGRAFESIENELISSMIRNMVRHRAEESKEGYEWTMWQAKQLESLALYKKRNEKQYKAEFKDLNRKIEEALRESYGRGGMAEERKILKAIKKGFKSYKPASAAMQAEFFKLNERKLEALINSISHDMKKAETAVLRLANDKYRRAIFNAQVYANTGAGTYEKAVDMATKDMLSSGLNCVQYKSGARHTLSSYARMAIRTASKRAYLQGEGSKRQEWGISTVILNKRSNACPLCAPFVGKIFIDDVWSGGKQSDGKYPLLSTAVASGLYHPNCKDSHTTYFPGISIAEDTWTKEELEKVGADYREEQKQQHAKRQAERFERLAEYSLDEDNKRMHGARSEQWKMLAGKSDELTARRKERLAARNKTAPGRIEIAETVNNKQRDLMESLANQYKTRLQKVTSGAVKAAGDVDISGAHMRLSSAQPDVAIHEFAHTLANTAADRYGLARDHEFWKEIAKIRREYRRDVGTDTTRWISSYEKSSGSLDEFMAEAFTHAKMREMKLPIPDKYGNDFTYSQKVLEVVNRYFGKNAEVGNAIDKVSKSDIINTGARITNTYSKEARSFAKMYYEEIRHFTTDVKRISANIGKSEADIQKIKSYLFLDKSYYDEDVKEWVRFTPDCAIAQSWQRLMIGKDIKKHDITLIEHELYEMKLKAENPNITHLEAHGMAQSKYNYSKEVEEYYGNLKKYNQK